MSFRLHAHRFRFHAIDSVYFPPDKAGNVLRGALLTDLRLDAPQTKPPSGLADPPRPFVLRAAHLNGLCFQPGDTFSFDLHVFDLRHSVADRFAEVFSLWESSGIGPRRGRVRALPTESTFRDITIDLAQPERSSSCTILFETPTALKGSPSADEIPFGVLFARARDRVATLSGLYGDGPPPVDFRGMSQRAAMVRTKHSDISSREIVRRSSRTGQTHGIGGVTGTVAYEGGLGEFLPWLRAAVWTGVGRHTVWGNGALSVVVP